MSRAMPILAALSIVAITAGAQAQPHGGAQAEDPHARHGGGNDGPAHGGGPDHSGGHGADRGDGEHGGGHGLQAPAPIRWGFGDSEAEGEDEGHAAPPMLLALLNFAIFAGILYWKAGPPIRRYLANRHDTVKDALAESAKLRDDAREKLDEYSDKLGKADATSNKIRDEIRADAQLEKKLILEAAQQQTDAINRIAEDRIAAETARARIMLEREVVTAAVVAAEKLLREKTTPADQHALVDGFIAELVPKAPPPGATSAVDEEWS